MDNLGQKLEAARSALEAWADVLKGWMAEQYQPVWPRQTRSWTKALRSIRVALGDIEAAAAHHDDGRAALRSGK